MDQVKFVEDSLQKFWRGMVCVKLRIFKGTNVTWSILEYFLQFLILFVNCLLWKEGEEF